jgi:ATP-binding cassette, subfamily B, bacterial HlyB/CyaB
MTADTQNPLARDAGLLALVMLLRFNGIGADPEQISHELGASTVGIPEMLRFAKRLGLRARVY